MLQDEKRSPHSLFQLLDKLRTTASKQESCPSVAVKNHDIIWFDLVNFELSCNPQVRPTKLVSVADYGCASGFCRRFEILGVYEMYGEDSLPASWSQIRSSILDRQ